MDTKITLTKLKSSAKKVEEEVKKPAGAAKSSKAQANIAVEEE